MMRPLQATKVNMQAFAEAGLPLIDAVPLQKLERLAQESIAPKHDFMVNWQAVAELRAGSAGQSDIWLHLMASTCLALTCQRCMGAVQAPLQVDQWYRFVATEDIAMAEDDASEEDLLVLASQFDLLAVLEDELLMALPLVPMHEACPELPAFSAGVIDVTGVDPALEAKPNPFAALAKLKKS